MFKWFNGLQPAQATVVAALFGGAATILIAVLTILVKDYLIPVISERRVARVKRNETFKRYANPLILASIPLLYRLREIILNRGYFLSDNSAKNEFNNYKYISTLYRFCSLLGWIRAAAIELSFVEVKSSEQYLRIQQTIGAFEKVLADGHELEVAILEDIANLWNVDISNLLAADKVSIGYMIECRTDDFCWRSGVKMATYLDNVAGLELAVTIAQLISEATKQQIDRSVIENEVIEFKRELSRTSGLIYRDWQSAIGDVMLRKTEKESRKFDIIGFREFEEIYLNGDTETKKWLNRVEKLFKNLDVSVRDRFDGRTKQLKCLYSALYEILVAFSKVDVSNVGLADDTLKKLPATLT